MAGGVSPAQAYAAALRGAPRGPRRSKYGNVKTKVDGLTFDSARESRRYMELSLLERAGQIRTLICQPKFEFVVNGVKIGTFKPDFSYWVGDRRVIEDVKSRDGKVTRTEAYVLRRKLLLACHGLEVIEI